MSDMLLDNNFLELVQKEGVSHPPDARGRFGQYGGRFVPETLMSAILDLEEQFCAAWADKTFLRSWLDLLRDYVGRPSPIYQAKRLSEAVGGTIWLKREDLNHTGAHKINNTLGQALLAERLGKRKLIAETGAGQHGLATATAAALLGLQCNVYMGEEDIRRQALNVHKMRMLGATVVPVTSGTRTLKDATNEALRTWVATVADTHYIIGSAVGPHPYPWMVRAFQSVIGLEARLQLSERGIQPDLIIACIGGGSNASGTFQAFRDTNARLMGVEAGGRGFAPGDHGASLALGRTGVLHGSIARLLQTETGQIQPAHSISAGLDYPGVGPELAFLAQEGRLEVCAVRDEEARAGFFQLTELEGILPALESSHAIAALNNMTDSLQGKQVLLTLSGRGDKDVDQILAGEGAP